MSKRNAVTTFFTNRVTKALGMTLALMMTCQSAMASLAADQTRYIFRGDKDALTITVTNNDKERTFGGQAWVDNIVEKDTRPTFVVTPSFFKVKPNGQQTLRIIMASDHLPKDKAGYSAGSGGQRYCGGTAHEAETVLSSEGTA